MDGSRYRGEMGVTTVKVGNATLPTERIRGRDGAFVAV